ADTMVHVAASMLANAKRGRNAPPAAVHGLAVRDEVRNARDADAPLRQAVVERTEPNGPATKAGRQRGDVLLRVGDLAVASSMDLERAVVEHAAGDKVPVVFRRGSSEQRTELTLAARAAPVTTDVVWRKLGVRLQPVGSDGVTRVNP